MDAKKAVLTAFGLAVVLPYLTVAFMQTGRLGIAAVTALFLGAFLLIIYSDVGGSGDSAEQ